MTTSPSSRQAPVAGPPSSPRPLAIGALAVVAALAGLLAAGPATAQSAGTLMGRIGLTQIKPDVASDNLTPPSLVGTQADIRADTQPTAGLTYMLTDQIALDLPIAAGFTHEIVGDGAIRGVGKIGQVKALPLTLLLQYRFLAPDAALRPYIGAGPTFARFYKARSTATLTALTGGTPSRPTTLSVESRWGATVQVGATYAFAPRWFADIALGKTFLDTRTTLSTGQTLDTRLDPWSLMLGVGTRF